MPSLAATGLVALFLIGPVDVPENPWVERVGPAVRAAEKRPTVENYRRALDAAWRSDDWAAGMKLVEKLRGGKLADSTELQPYVARALWRGGQVLEAERVAQRFDPESQDPVALVTAITIHLSRAERAAAERLAERLEALPASTAEELFAIFSVRLTANRLEGAVELVRKAAAAIDAKNGYPDIFLLESLEGLPEFLAAAGTKPLNRVARFGRAPMKPLPLLNVPYADVFLNGRGPYRFIVDTGGSIMLSVDSEVAREVGLKSIAKATVRGVSGTDESDQLLVERVQIGSIVCERVVARGFGVRNAIMGAADGIIGTGIFGDARLTMDLHGGEMVVSESGDQPGAGEEAPLRIISDAKLMTPMTLHGKPSVGLFDSGADAVAISPDRLKKLFPGRQIEVQTELAMGVGSGAGASVSINPGVNLQIGRREYRNYSGLGLDVLDTTLSPFMGMQTEVLIGMPVFRDMKTFTIDFARGELWIDWAPQ